MKQSYFLLIFLILLFVCGKGYAQMQGINASSERFVSSSQINNTYTKVRPISRNHLLTLSHLSNFNDRSAFARTKMGNDTMEVGVIIDTSFSVYDFKVYKDHVCFCGAYTNNNITNGFIAWAKLDNFFNYGQFEYEIVNITSVIYNLEVFIVPSTGDLKLVALGYNIANLQYKYSLIDYSVWNNPGNYDIYGTNDILQNITQTDKYIAVIISDTTYREFGIIRHYKDNFSNVAIQSFALAYNGIITGDAWDRFPQYNKPNILAEWIGSTPNIIVATSTKQNFPFLDARYSIEVFNIDLDNLSVLTNQIIPNGGKPYVKDMVYMPYDSTVHLIVNGEFGDTYSTVPSNDRSYTDFLYRLPVWNSSDYLAEILLPSVCDFGEDVLNSITRYNRRYYVIGGRLQQTDELYWFDRKIDIPTSLCYKNYETKVYFVMPYPIQSIPYTSMQFLSSTAFGSFFSTSTVYDTICLD